MRYLTGLIIGPTIIGFPLLFYKHIQVIKKLSNNLTFSLLLIGLPLIALSGKPPLHQKNLLSYYPKIIDCFDQHAKTLNLHNGLAPSFTLANFITAESKANVRIANIDLDQETLKFNTWDSTLKFKDIHNFDFLIIPSTLKNSFFEKFITYAIKHFGKPTNTFICYNPKKQGGITVYAYTNGAMKNVKLISYNSERSVYGNEDEGMED